MATAVQTARATTSYEELIIDILVTKSLVFSVVGLGPDGLRWIHRLTENGFPTIGVPRSDMPTSLPNSHGHGLLHLGSDYGEVSGSDVILFCAAPQGDEFEILVPHLRRGQVLCYPTASRMSQGLKGRLIDTAKERGLRVGLDFFITNGGAGSPDASGRSSISGTTEACARVGRAIHDKILGRLISR